MVVDWLKRKKRRNWLVLLLRKDRLDREKVKVRDWSNARTYKCENQKGIREEEEEERGRRGERDRVE